MANDDAPEATGDPMTMREKAFAAALFVSSCLVVTTVALALPVAAPAVAGLLLAGWAWLVCGGDEKP